jgi:uncharacterized protein (TIGR02391 family)
MSESLLRFEQIARSASALALKRPCELIESLHPFDSRNVHPEIAAVSKKLFDDGHYSQATFEAFKFVDLTVRTITSVKKAGFQLMMDVFGGENPKIRITNLSNLSEVDEQKGYSFLFAGSVMAIRNPRGHLVGNIDTIDQCLDYLCIASLLMRRIDGRTVT